MYLTQDYIVCNWHNPGIIWDLNLDPLDSSSNLDIVYHLWFHSQIYQVTEIIKISYRNPVEVRSAITCEEFVAASLWLVTPKTESIVSGFSCALGSHDSLGNVVLKVICSLAWRLGQTKLAPAIDPTLPGMFETTAVVWTGGGNFGITTPRIILLPPITCSFRVLEATMGLICCKGGGKRPSLGAWAISGTGPCRTWGAPGGLPTDSFIREPTGTSSTARGGPLFLFFLFGWFLTNLVTCTQSVSDNEFKG